MKNEKLIQIAKRMDIVCKIIEKFALVASIIAAICIPVLFIFKEKAITDITKIDTGFISFIYESDAYAPSFESILPGLIITLLASIIYTLIIWYGFKTLRMILKPMKEGLPFAKENPKQLKKLSLIVIIGGILSQCCDMMAKMTLLKTFNIQSVINTDVIKDITYNFNLDFTPILIGLVIFFLAYIFEYGVQLQQESDETL